MTIKNGYLAVWFEYDDETSFLEETLVWALEEYGATPTDWDLNLDLNSDG